MTPPSLQADWLSLSVSHRLLFCCFCWPSLLLLPFVFLLCDVISAVVRNERAAVVVIYICVSKRLHVEG